MPCRKGNTVSSPVREFRTSPSPDQTPRRTLLRTAAGLPFLGALAGLADQEQSAARKRRKRCKARSRRKICAGKCGIVKSRKTCGKKVDCGACCGASTVACGARELCVDDLCLACDVVCETPNRTCAGEALQTALAAGGSIHVCPGRYTGGFVINASVSLTGAGSGDDPATNTILDGLGTQRVVKVNQAPTPTLASFSRVRIQGGSDEGGAGLDADASTEVNLVACTVADNFGTDPDSEGGGLQVNGTLRMTDCLVERNEAGEGGGIFVDNGTTVLRNTIIRNNAAIRGGGVYVDTGSLLLEPGTLVTGNTGNTGAGIFSIAGSSVTVSADATVTANSPDNCVIHGVLAGICPA